MDVTKESLEWAGRSLQALKHRVLELENKKTFLLERLEKEFGVKTQEDNEQMLKSLEADVLTLSGKLSETMDLISSLNKRIGK